MNSDNNCLHYENPIVVINKYLYENYGREKMIKLWQKGFSELKNIYGFDITQLEKDINNEMENTKYQEVDWSELMEKGCG